MSHSVLQWPYLRQLQEFKKRNSAAKFNTYFLHRRRRQNIFTVSVLCQGIAEGHNDDCDSTQQCDMLVTTIIHYGVTFFTTK